LASLEDIADARLSDTLRLHALIARPNLSRQLLLTIGEKEATSINAV